MPRILLALAILGFALTVPAFAGSGVDIIYPPALEIPEATVPPPATAPTKVIKQNVVTVIIVRPRLSNREIVKRALFQNYTGFINEYSGPRYPF
jgi:hypothetical protein